MHLICQRHNGGEFLEDDMSHLTKFTIWCSGCWNSKYSASDSGHATGGNWKKSPQRMTLMPPNKCVDGPSLSTILTMAMLCVCQEFFC